MTADITLTRTEDYAPEAPEYAVSLDGRQLGTVYYLSASASSIGAGWRISPAVPNGKRYWRMNPCKTRKLAILELIEAAQR